MDHLTLVWPLLNWLYLQQAYFQTSSPSEILSRYEFGGTPFSPGVLGWLNFVLHRLWHFFPLLGMHLILMSLIAFPMKPWIVKWSYQTFVHVIILQHARHCANEDIEGFILCEGSKRINKQTNKITQLVEIDTQMRGRERSTWQDQKKLPWSEPGWEWGGACSEEGGKGTGGQENQHRQRHRDLKNNPVGGVPCISGWLGGSGVSGCSKQWVRKDHPGLESSWE